MTRSPGAGGARSGPLHHLVTAADWHACSQDGEYTPHSLAAEGFVHLSAPDQLATTATRHYAGVEDLLVVTVDAAALGDLVVWEDLLGHGTFPHCYGPLPAAAITSIEPYPARPA